MLFKKHPYFNMIENSKKGFRVVKREEIYFKDRMPQKSLKLMHQFIFLEEVSLLKKHKLLNKKTTIYIMPRERSVDIDDIYDFNIVKLYMKKKWKII